MVARGWGGSGNCCPKCRTQRLQLRIFPISLHVSATSVKVRFTRKGGPAKTRSASAGERGSESMTEQRASAAPAQSADTDVALKLETFLPYRLNVCSNLVSQALSRVYAERYKIGVPEWRVLVTLGQFGLMTAKAIGTHSHMHKTKVSRA